MTYSTQVSHTAYPVHAGLSNLTEAYGQYFNSQPAGSPQLDTLGYPDNKSGNAGLCRHQTYQKIMPQDPVTQTQATSEDKAIASYLQDPDSVIFHSLGNITNPVMVLGGTLDVRISVQDVYTLINHIPGASFHQFIDAGHESVQQHAVTAGTFITSFLDQQSVGE